MAPSAGERVFAVTELCERILSDIHASNAVQTLFTIQRVNRSIRDVVQGSSSLRIEMGLQHERQHAHLKADRATCFPSAAIRALGENVSVSPFYARSSEAPEALKNILPRAISFSSDTLLMRPNEVWKLHVDNLGWGEPIGLKGRKRFHSFERASWRNINLFTRPCPLVISIAVRLGQISKYEPYTEGTPMRDPYEQSFILRDSAQRNVAWDGWQEPRYVETVRFAPEQATLGNLAATLQETLQRTEAEHHRLSLSLWQETSRDFGEELCTEAKIAEDE